MKKYAPVLIPTLNRYKHFKNCVTSLAENTLANETHLFIALDYPAKPEHFAGYKEINDYIDTISGFKKVTVFKRDLNFGAAQNTITARKEIFNQYDEIIVSEDDNFFSPNFLEYINDGLNRYKNDDTILAICGYNYPIEIPENYPSNVYLWPGFSAWGFATWKDKFNQIRFSVETIKDFIASPPNILRINEYADHYFPALLDIVKTNHVTGDTAICMHIIKHNMSCVFPTVSKVRNYGHDGSGIHCGHSEIYRTQPIDHETHFAFMPVSNPDQIHKKLKKHFSLRLKTKIKTYLKYIHFLSSRVFRKLTQPH